jgi:hypothetical protein
MFKAARCGVAATEQHFNFSAVFDSWKAAVEDSARPQNLMCPFGSPSLAFSISAVHVLFTQTA